LNRQNGHALPPLNAACLISPERAKGAESSAFISLRRDKPVCAGYGIPPNPRGLKVRQKKMLRSSRFFCSLFDACDLKKNYFVVSYIPIDIFLSI